MSVSFLKYFVVNNTKRCNQAFSHKTSTGILSRHLRIQHGLTEGGPDISAGSLEKYCVYSDTSDPKLAANNAILTFMADNSLSASLFDSLSWKSMIQCILRVGSSFRPPSASTISDKLLPAAVIDMRALLKE